MWQESKHTLVCRVLIHCLSALLWAAVNTRRTLLGLPWYRGNIDGKHEVMIGYSDSAKDAGKMAAAWAQYRAQVCVTAQIYPYHRQSNISNCLGRSSH